MYAIWLTIRATHAKHMLNPLLALPFECRKAIKKIYTNFTTWQVFIYYLLGSG